MNNEYLKSFQFERFAPEKEGWEYYIQRFKMELQIYDLDKEDQVTQKKRRNLLLSKVGPDAFKLLVDHFKPEDVSTKSFDDLVQVLNKYYGKTTYILSERVAFALRYRNADETVNQFLNILRGLAGNCEFGDNLKERLRDQFVIGINNSAWQQELIRLHPKNTATLEEIEASALILEQAVLQSKRLSSLSQGQWDRNHTNRVGSFSNKHSSEQSSRFNQHHKQKPHEHKQTNKTKVLDAEKECLMCGNTRHKQKEQCPAKNKKCLACGALNHFSKVCISAGNARILNQNRQGTKNSTRYVREGETEEDHNVSDHSYSSTDTSKIHNIPSSNKIMLTTKINNRNIEMLYDPGAAHSVVGKKLWKEIGSPNLKKTANLVAYTEVEIETLGIAEVNVEAFQNSLSLPLYVTKTNDIPLFRLDWCIAFNLPFPPGARLCQVNAGTTTTPNESSKLVNVNKTSSFLEINSLLSKYDELFTGHIGSIKGHLAKIHMKNDSIPKTFRPRPVPIALQEQVAAELDRLVKENVLEQVDTSITPIEWATPIVLAIKSNGSIRICGDFSVSINPHVIKDDYPLPRFEDIMSKLSGGKHFSKVDLKDAYLQLEVEPDSRKYLVICTHKGYYRYKRLPFGVNFAPSPFQRTMDQLLSGIDGTVCYIDDILITAPNEEIHLKRLEQVLGRLKNAGVSPQKSKCKWLQKSVTFLGHLIDEQGLHPTTEHLTAIQNMPNPRNVSELGSFLGSITYYGRFIRDLHVICTPLYRHLKKGNTFTWTNDDEALFRQLKNILTSSDTLVHYDQTLPLILTSDASEKGAGAVLFHKFTDGSLKPIAFASRTFNDIETRYSTIDKEALGIVFAVTKFHHYVYGRHFTLLTDHKPLERIFSKNRETPKIASNRLLRWAMILNSYDFTISYQPGKENAPADVLSRLPLPDTYVSPSEEIGLPKRGHLLNLRLHHLPITKRLLQEKTSSDKTFLKIIRCLRTYWPDKRQIPSELLSFYEKRDELSFEENILLWKGRICIPETLRQNILLMLHDGHPGISAMQSSARLHVYWPNIDNDIIEHVKSCLSCQESKQNEKKLPLYPWSPPPEPWSRVHIDFAGPFEGKMWFIVMDAYTRWLEVIPMKNITTSVTLSVLREVFSRMGYPKIIVSDNGPQLTSEEFQLFCKKFGITHVRTTPYHPKTNGLAERAVKTFKERMTASDDRRNQEDRLYSFLFNYRNTIQRSTGRAPSELLFGRPLRSLFDQLKPDLFRNMDKAKLNQKRLHDKGARYQEFQENQLVCVNNPLGKGSSSGEVVERTGPYSYVVDIDGRLKRKHGDQLRPRSTIPEEGFSPLQTEPVSLLNQSEEYQEIERPKMETTPTEVSSPSRPRQQSTTLEVPASFEPINAAEVIADTPTPISDPRRNPHRERRVPARYQT